MFFRALLILSLGASRILAALINQPIISRDDSNTSQLNNTECQAARLQVQASGLNLTATIATIANTSDDGHRNQEFAIGCIQLAQKDIELLAMAAAGESVPQQPDHFLLTNITDLADIVSTSIIGVALGVITSEDKTSQHIAQVAEQLARGWSSDVDGVIKSCGPVVNTTVPTVLQQVESQPTTSSSAIDASQVAGQSMTSVPAIDASQAAAKASSTARVSSASARWVHGSASRLFCLTATMLLMKRW